LFAVQFFVFWKTYTVFGWDSVLVRDVGTAGFTDTIYFAKCPNNIMTAVLMRLWVLATSMFTFISPILRLTIMNVLFVDVAVAFGYLCTKKMLGILAADRYAVSAAILVMFSPWTAVHYSDTLSSPFPIRAVYFILCSREAKSKKSRNIYMALAVFTAVFGAYLKLTTIIVVIALVIVLILNGRIKFNKDRLSLYAGALSGAVVAFIFVQILFIQPKQLIARDFPHIKARGFYYFLETGMSNFRYGNWSGKAWEFATERIYDEDYEEQARERIVNIVKSYGAAGLVEHLYYKLLWAGTDGTYIYGAEGDFHHEAQADQSTLRGKLQNIIYVDNPFYQNWYAQWLQGAWLRVCIQCALSVFYKRDKNSVLLISKLAVGGLFLFLMIFENRSRYIILYVPVIIMIAQAGAIALKTKMKIKK